jgi:hypothetical protein
LAITLAASRPATRCPPGPWLAQRHLTEWIAYQPHSHLVWLMLARNGIIIAVAALAVLASIWWLRKHPAE